jgi:lycopene beta-cyclase
MRTEYLIVLGAILLFPLILSIVMPLRLYARWRAMVLSMVFVSIPYWIWDLLVTARGHWSFNPSYVLGITILGMPVEEWLFFIVITFVSIFTYEAVRYVVGRRARP